MNNWNPLYVEYAASHGNTPEAQLAADAAQFPAAKMLGFILWCSHRSRP